MQKTELVRAGLEAVPIDRYHTELPAAWAGVMFMGGMLVCGQG